MTELTESLVVLGAVAWVTVFTAGTAIYAASRDRSAAVWALYGSILGPIAVTLVALAPPGRCAACGSRGVGWQARCASCSDAGGRAPMAIPIEPDGLAAAYPTVGHWRDAIPASSGVAVVAGHTWETSPSSHDGPAPSQAEVAAPVRLSTLERSRVLASAVYAGGSAPLTIGLRYIVALDGDDLQVRGPVDRDPNILAFSCPLAGLEVLGVGNRLTLSSTTDRSRPITMGFLSLSGETGEALERVITAELPGFAGQR